MRTGEITKHLDYLGKHSIINKNKRSIADLSNKLLSEGYEYVLTGRFQTDPLEHRFSRYRQISGGRFLVSLNEVLSSESIVKIKSMLERDFEFSALEICLMTV